MAAESMAGCSSELLPNSLADAACCSCRLSTAMPCKTTLQGNCDKEPTRAAGWAFSASFGCCSFAKTCLVVTCLVIACVTVVCGSTCRGSTLCPIECRECRGGGIPNDKKDLVALHVILLKGVTAADVEVSCAWSTDEGAGNPGDETGCFGLCLIGLPGVAAVRMGMSCERSTGREAGIVGDEAGLIWLCVTCLKGVRALRVEVSRERSTDPMAPNAGTGSLAVSHVVCPCPTNLIAVAGDSVNTILLWWVLPIVDLIRAGDLVDNILLWLGLLTVDPIRAGK